MSKMTAKKARKIARETNRFIVKDTTEPNKFGVFAMELCVGKPLCARKAKSGPCAWCFKMKSDDKRTHDELAEAMDRKH